MSAADMDWPGYIGCCVVGRFLCWAVWVIFFRDNRGGQ